MLKALGSRLTYANVVATGALFVALGGGAYALTGIPDRGGVYHGCVDPKIGALRVVKTASACRRTRTVRRGIRRVRIPGESAIAWNQQGQRGIQGQNGMPGQNGLTGASGKPGQDATKLFAFIGDLGAANTATISYGNGVTAVDDPAGNNAYTVTFDRSLVNCVVQATEGFGNPLIGSAASFDGFPSVNMVGTSNPNQVQVSFRHASGSPTTYATTDDSFMITAFC